MGQYYKPLIVDKNGNISTLHSHEFDNGLKLMEHSWIGNNFVNAVYILIHNNPCKVVWMGDYADDVSEDFAIQAGGKKQFNIFYRSAWKRDDEISLGPEYFNGTDLSAFMTDDTKGMYLINHNKGLYIPMEEYIATNSAGSKDDLWCINPLPLLTACGNGQGGGDYRGINVNSVGAWAFNTLEYSDRAPEGFHSVMYNFKEC